MAGWTMPDRELAIWKGTLQADKLKGDGSAITGVTAPGDNLGDHIATQTVSGANLQFTGEVSGATIYGDGSNLTNLPPGSESDPIWVAASGAVHGNIATVSGAITTHAALVDEHLDWTASVGTIHADNYTDTTYTGGNDITLDGTAMDLNTGVSGAITANSSAITNNAAGIAEVSGALFIASGAFIANIATVSGALTTHEADSTDPHGATLSQTNLNVSTTVSGSTINGGLMTAGDMTSGAIVNVYFGTSATPPVANTTPLGSLYVQYTA